MEVAMRLAATAVISADGLYHGQRVGWRNSMSGQPRAAEWEYLVEGDLAPHLVPAGRPSRARLASEASGLPAGAHEGIAASLGPVRPDDLLVIPAAAWPLRGWQRRCLYSPLCVAAIGEQAAGLWVRDLPLPGVRARLALDDVALVEHRTVGAWHALTVIARTGTLIMRYDENERSRVDAWTRRLRLRVASLRAPLPPAYPSGQGGHLDALLLAPEDGVVAVGHRGGRLRRCCLLAVTPRELLIEQTWRDWRRPWRTTSQTLYLPLQSVCSAIIRGKTLRLESAGTTVRVRLASRKTAATAATWLASLLNSHKSHAA
jgi:hypothetical protein